MQGGTKLSKLVFREVYNQALVDDDTKKAVVTNMHKGLFTYDSWLLMCHFYQHSSNTEWKRY